jgi:hypothetical protein
MTSAILDASAVARAARLAHAALIAARDVVQVRRDHAASELKSLFTEELRELEEQADRMQAIAALACEALDGRIAIDVDDFAVLAEHFAVAKRGAGT